jgi:ubiquitin carboxyl-terminal hydrolase 25/28
MEYEEPKFEASQISETVGSGEGISSAQEVNLDEDHDQNPDAEVPDVAPEVPSKLYHNITHNVFKTSNRLIDDIKADLLFLLNKENTDEELQSGILKLFPIRYSEKLASIKHNPYDIYTLNQELVYAPSVEHQHSRFDPKDRVTVIRSLLFNTSEASLSRSKVYHVKIQIKVKQFTSTKAVAKNEYHLVEQLNNEDTLDLIEEETVRGVTDDLVSSALPNIIDSANYVCSVTNKILRIEISEPEFDHEDLHDYEIGPINIRYNKALAQYQNLDPAIPSPAQCLYTLFKAIRGPLLLQPGDEHKTISTSNKVLNSKINPKILVRKLQFKIDGDSFDPPNFADYATNPTSAVIRESYIRKVLAIGLLGTKSYSGNSENPFRSQVSFVKDLNTIFHQLDDNASIRHHEYLKIASFINLSVYPFYSDDFIKTCYEKMVQSDPQHIPTYFDSLKDISSHKATYKLSSFVSNLTKAGIIGQREIDNAYKSLGLAPQEGDLVDDDLLLTMYQNEVSQHPLDSKLRPSLQLIANYRDSEKLLKHIKYEPLLIKEAYDILDIDSHVDDDIVATALMIKMADEPSNIPLFNRAFITIAVDRKSFKLLDKMEKDFPDIYEPLTFKDSCQYLGVDENANEIQIITVSQVGSYEIRKARNALRTIGEYKNSKVIKAFLETGLIDHNLLPAENWPVGLNNIGNTCYLNSLLQYYFSIKPFRDAILNFNDVYNGEEIYQNRRIGGRLVGDSEVERSFQFTYHLRDLFHDQIHSQLRCITPKKELAYLAFLPSVTSVEFGDSNSDLAEYVNEFGAHSGSEARLESEGDVDVVDLDGVSHIENQEPDLIDMGRSDDDDLIIVDEEMNQVEPDDDADGNEGNDDLSDAMILGTSPVKPTQNEELGSKVVEPEPKQAKVAKIREAEMETAYEIGRQQDVTECIGNVLSQVEAALKPEGFDESDHEQNDLVKHLFYGKTVQHLNDIHNPSIKRDKVDKFSNLFVNISDKPRNIYEAFDFVFKSEELSIDNGTFKRCERITKLPIILQVQIQRVYFDRVALRPYKSIEPLAFPETLYMDRYFDTGDATILKKREEVDEWKVEISKLKERREKLLTKDSQGITFKDSLKTTKDWLEANSLAKPETLKTLETQIAKIDSELMNIYTSIEMLENQIDHQFDGFTKHGYSIFAIFIHRGEANYGHYWIYIKDTKSEIYRKYNDEIVSEVTKTEVFNFEEGNTATPYFLGYIKHGHEKEIEPLCRVLAEEQSS